MLSTPVTNRALRIEVTRTTAIDVPAGTVLRRVLDGTGKAMYAVADPFPFIKSGCESFGRHDLTYYYAWVPADAVTVSP